MTTAKKSPGLPVEAPTSAPETVEQLIRQAEAAAASDIHLQMEDAGAVVSFRLDRRGWLDPKLREIG